MERSPAPGRITAEPPRPPASEMSPPEVPSAPRPGSHAVPVVLAALAIAVQITHPLLGGRALHVATVVAVLAFAAASLAHAAVTAGPAVAVRVLVVAGGVGLLAEAVGVATGLPFGAYHYADTLGPRLAGVPLVVPLAWTMTAYPCLLLGRALAPARWAAVALAAWTLAAWDLFLDPQMVADGHWTWTHPDPGLPGIPGVPLTNTAGWLLVSAVLIAALDRALPRRALPPRAPGAGAPPPDAAVPALLLGWTWLGSVTGNLVFFDRPAVAGYGGLAMGATVLPYLLHVARPHPARPRRRAAGTP